MSNSYCTTNINHSCDFTIPTTPYRSCWEDWAEKTINRQNDQIQTLEAQLLHMNQLVLKLEKRVSVIEFSPPPLGGNVFNEILQEAKDAGDIS